MIIQLVEDAYIAARNKSEVHDSGAEKLLGQVFRNCFKTFWALLTRKKKPAKTEKSADSGKSEDLPLNGIIRNEDVDEGDEEHEEEADELANQNEL